MAASPLVTRWDGWTAKWSLLNTVVKIIYGDGDGDGDDDDDDGNNNNLKFICLTK